MSQRTALVADLTIVRHGQSLANVAFPAADAQGRTDAGVPGRDADVPLTDLGRRQAATLGPWLAAHRPDVVITSPYRRTRDTWRLAADAAAVALPTPQVDDRLRDRVMGRLEMLTQAAIRQRFPEEIARRTAAGEFGYRPPGGESFGDVAARLTAFLDDLNARHHGRRVFVVAHDAVVLMLRAVIEGLTFDQVAGIVADGPVRNASITRFVNSDGGLRLVDYNVVTHLEPAPSPGGSGPDQSADEPH